MGRGLPRHRADAVRRRRDHRGIPRAAVTARRSAKPRSARRVGNTSEPPRPGGIVLNVTHVFDPAENVTATVAEFTANNAQQDAEVPGWTAAILGELRLRGWACFDAGNGERGF